MRILFIQPDSFNPVINYGAHIYNFEPLGLYYLASTVHKNHDVYFLDLNTEMNILMNKDDNLFQNSLSEINPDIVAFSALTSVTSGRINQLCNIAKKEDNRIVTVVGGLHASLSANDFTQNPYIDIILKRNAISTFSEVVQLIEKNVSINNINEFINSKELNTSIQTHLNSWPFPYRELGNKYKEHYEISIGKPGKNKIKEPISSLKTSLGCPFRCNFCCLWQQYPKYEQRNIDSIIEELGCIKTEYVFFADDESMINANFMGKLADEIYAAEIRKKFVMYARADTIVKNKVLLDKWKKAGLVEIWIGIEGGTNKQLNRYNKQNNIASHIEAIKLIRQYGINVHTTTLVDISFTEDDFKYLYEHVKYNLTLTSCHFFILTPFK
ncbi:Hopanoid C-3 methylase [subsurface metagenome]